MNVISAGWRWVKSNVQETLATWLDNLPQPLAELQLVVAFSGGRDSAVLLHSLQSLRTRFTTLTIRAIHIHHGLHAQACHWAKHCEDIAATYQINCQVVRLALTPLSGQSVEEVARNGRYNAFKALLEPNEYLLTAHSEDDQAETVMLQLMRGAGPKGLCAMSPLKRLGQGKLARPLLRVSRQVIADYASLHGLTWVEDPSNQDPRFARNFLRHEVFSLLQTYFPGSSSCIARSAEHMGAMQQLLDEYIEVDLSTCLVDGNLDLQALNAFTSTKQMAILRAWLQHHLIRSPSTKILNSILQQALGAKIDAKVRLSFGNIILYRYQNKLYWEKDLPMNIPEEIVWDLSQPLMWAGKRWQAKLTAGQGLRLANIDAKLIVRARQGGERCRLLGEKISRSLKKVLQHQRIPFWQRQQLPLFYQGEELVCIGKSLVCEGWQVTTASELGWVIETVE
jgi:tRNA(Ile)-lysidine synthase